MRKVFMLVAKPARTYRDRDRIWSLFAPCSLLMLTVVWLVLILLGYAAMFAAIGIDGWQAALTTSGSSLLTLGFAPLATLARALLAFSEAMIGLFLVAILIAYLPTIYNAWSRREQLVSLLEVRAGTPPTPGELITRFHRLNRLDRLTDLWAQWELWFTDVEESHSSLTALSLFRSAHPDRSWIVAAGAVLDAAAFVRAALDVPGDPQADLMLRSGTLCLRRLCTIFRLPYNPDPHFPRNPIAVTRAEFDEVYDQLAEIGTPLVEDRDQAWSDFAGWRVNYDEPIRSMAGLTLAPKAPWSSDRAIAYPF